MSVVLLERLGPHFHQFPQSLNLNGVYGLNLDPDGQPSFWKNALEVLTNEEWPVGRDHD
jgi:hypothetical protein